MKGKINMEKKHWINGIICFVICLMIGILYPSDVKASGSQQVNQDNFVKADLNYYKSLGLDGTPTLTVYKHKADHPDVPVQGVEFKTKKIGDLYQIKTGTTHQMVYGIQEAIASKVGITSGDYTFDDGQQIIAFKDAKKINEAFQKNENRQIIQDLLKSETGVSTDATGKADLSTPNYGLYVVVETNVKNAKINGKPVSITWQTRPYVVSLPSYIANEKNWNEDVIVNTKNSIDDATLEKKIVTNYHSGNILTTDLETADTDITQGSDVVEFYLKMKIPQISPKSDSSIDTFIINDQASKAYNVNKNNFKILCDQTVLTATTDYQISTSQIVDDSNYKNGTAINIQLTDSGLNKITNESKANAKESYLHVYYLANVNNQVVVGPGGDQSGNPNRAQLSYRLSNNSLKKTDWDTVTTYTFGFDVLKKLDDQNISDTVAKEVQFVLYRQENGQKIYYTFDNINNQYYLTGTVQDENQATRISPVNESKVSVYGLEEGTYYLEEVKTIDGYHILKEPLKVIITAQKGENAFVGSLNEYTGLLMQENDNDGIASYEVINTKGFEIPATGGMGIWLFVLGGMSIIVIGTVYFYISGRKKKMM